MVPLLPPRLSSFAWHPVRSAATIGIGRGRPKDAFPDPAQAQATPRVRRRLVALSAMPRGASERPGAGRPSLQAQIGRPPGSPVHADPAAESDPAPRPASESPLFATLLDSTFVTIEAEQYGQRRPRDDRLSSSLQQRGRLWPAEPPLEGHPVGAIFDLLPRGAPRAKAETSRERQRSPDCR
jgi:hypothetical protein